MDASVQTILQNIAFAPDATPHEKALARHVLYLFRVNDERTQQFRDANAEVSELRARIEALEKRLPPA
jgi:hypothetical protein